MAYNTFNKPCRECGAYERCCKNGGWCDAQWDRAYLRREGKSDCWEEREKAEWISVEDRLPKWQVNVLTISESGKYEILNYDRGCWCYPSGVVKIIVFHITHWMPLPEPPTEGE